MPFPKNIFSTLVLLTGIFTQAQNIDSLKQALKSVQNDTIRCSILSALAENAPDGEWENYNTQLLTFCENKLKNIRSKNPVRETYLKYYAVSLNNQGLIYKYAGKSDKALEYYKRSLAVDSITGNKRGEARCLYNIGVIYDNLGDINLALDQCQKSIKIQEKIGDKEGLAASFGNLGVIYRNQGDLEKALEYYHKSLGMQKEIDDRQGISYTYNNIGGIYKRQNKFSEALMYFEQGLKVLREIGDKKGIASCLNNIGSVYNSKGDSDKALDFYTKSLELKVEISDKSGATITLQNIGEVYLQRKNYSKAIEFGNKSMQLSKELGYPENIRNSSSLLYKIYKAMGKEREALENYELYIRMRDSINNRETQKAAIKQQYKYAYEKKAEADSIKTYEEKRVVGAQLKQEKTQKYALYGGLTLVLFFAGFMFNRFKITQKQKNIIEQKEKETQLQNVIISEQKLQVEKQKHLVEEKHKEITDSINYAERIQRSFLATKELLDENLMDYFVFFKPKDIVSGDFYWAERIVASEGIEKFVVATADSTGHGVPGAIMSLLNITSLEKAIENFDQPAGILNETRKTIIRRLKKDGSAEGGKDGMDCSLCIYDFKNYKLTIAAANNPVWIVRFLNFDDNSSKQSYSSSKVASLSSVSLEHTNMEVIEIKPDKMPVGKHDKQDIPFTQHEIELKKGDVIYTLTDGFPDQFGGEKGKKLMSKNLRELLSQNAHLPMNEQKELLERTFSKWKGDLEQVDDVTLIGVRI